MISRNTLGDLMKRVFVPGHSGKRDVRDRSDGASGDSSTDDERRKDVKDKEKKVVKPLNLKAAEMKESRKGSSKSPLPNTKCTLHSPPSQPSQTLFDISSDQNYSL